MIGSNTGENNQKTVDVTGEMEFLVYATIWKIGRKMTEQQNQYVATRHHSNKVIIKWYRDCRYFNYMKE